MVRCETSGLSPVRVSLTVSAAKDSFREVERAVELCCTCAEPCDVSCVFSIPNVATMQMVLMGCAAPDGAPQKVEVPLLDVQESHSRTLRP